MENNGKRDQTPRSAKSQSISIRLPRDLYEDVRAAACKETRTFNLQITHILRWWQREQATIEPDYYFEYPGSGLPHDDQ